MPPRDTDDGGVRRFLEAILARYGQDFVSYAPRSMERRVRAALAKSRFSTLDELHDAVLADPVLFARLVEDLTVRVTGMFRDPSFHRAFRERVVPMLRTYPHFKIWHAGSATGEEVYSCAIILEEEGLYDRAQIYATDLSLEALGRATQGVYSDERMDVLYSNYVEAGGRACIDAYITRAYSRIQFRERLRKNILFFQHDLTSDYVFGDMHVILCRNVLVYFGSELRQRVLAKFAESIPPGGFLGLGNAERLREVGSKDAFEDYAPDERIYRRRAR